jgi:uncharacterized membrane protein YbjE (DUF340 family)
LEPLQTLLLVLVFFAFMPLGRKLRLPGKVVSAVVYALIFTVALWAGAEIPPVTVALSVVVSFIYAAFTLTVTYAIGAAVLSEPPQPIGKGRASLGLAYLIPLTLGMAVGLTTKPNLPFGELTTYELYLLMALMGLEVGKAINLKVIRASLGFGVLAALVNFSGAIVSGAALSLLLAVPLRASLGITLGSGWYSFDGPFLASVEGPYYGVVGFLTNFLREQLVFVALPALSKLRESPLGGIASGGATSMDVTLPFLTEFYGYRSSVSSMVSGVIITVLVPAILPLVYQLP